MEKKSSRYIAPVIVAAVIAAAYFLIKKVYAAEDAGRLIGGISDSFLVPGTLLCGIGLISWAGKFGTFDMLGYSTRLFAGHFSKSLSEKTPKTFYDYKKTKDEKGRTWLKECTAVGAACIALSVIFMAIYYII